MSFTNYNGQISVDEREQFIVANELVTECNDHHQLIPMIEKSRETLGRVPDVVKGDNGYHAELIEAVNKYKDTQFYIDDRNRRKEDLDMNKMKKEYDEIKYKNLERLVSVEGTKEYKKRMHTAEPPFGWMKFNSGYRYFLMRGKEKVGGEFNLLCIGYNLKKIKKYMEKVKLTIGGIKEILSGIGNGIGTNIHVTKG